MKIVILANNDVGLYQFRRELILALLRQGHAVSLSLPHGPLVEPLIEAGCTFVDTPLDRRGIDPMTDLKLLGRYFRLLRSEKPDLVITYTIKPNVYGGLCCRLLRIPYAANVTGLGTTFQKEGMLKTLVTTLYRIALKKAKRVFFENAVNRQIFIDARILPAEQCHRLNGAGVNLSHYRYSPYPATEPVRFLFIGRIMKEKGIEELLNAMERLHREGAVCRLDVLGDYEEDYAALFQRCAEQGWLCYHGHQEDVRPFIAAAHCFVLPSYHEGMANTNLECAAMGRPLITSRIPGCMEAVREEESGFLCEPQNADSLYAAMKRFLSLSPADRAQMGQAGRTHMEAVFDKENVVKETMEQLGL